jgi:hypothetical protein
VHPKPLVCAGHRRIHVRIGWYRLPDMNVPTPIRYLPAISEQIHAHFGDDSFVLHEATSSTVHVDLHVVRPNPQRPYFTLLSSGMSDLDMAVPPEYEELALAEVCLCLPDDWPLGVHGSDWRKPEYFWPLRLLYETARYPHQQGTWLYWGHTLGGSDAPLPFGVPTDFTGAIILPPQTFSEAAMSVKTHDGRTINFLAIVPIHSKEMNFRFENGSEALARKLFEAGVNELLRPDRPSVL